MKKATRIFALFLALLMLTGCGVQSTSRDTTPTFTESGMTAPSDLVSLEPQQEIDVTSPANTVDLSEVFSDRDYEADYDTGLAVLIQLDGSTAQCSSDAVEISDSTVTILDEGTYVLSGTLDDGMVIVNTENTDKIQLVLDGVNINSSTSAAIYVAQADKVFLTLAPNSENILSNGGEFVSMDDNNIDATIFSKDDLTLNGSGSLSIHSPAGHGVVSKDDLIVTGGNYTVTAASHGFSGKDCVGIADGTFSITAGKDGIHAENADDASLGDLYLVDGTYDITAEGDGISATGDLQITDGTYTVQTGGGSDTVEQGSDGEWGWNRPGQQATESSVSAKGMKADGNLLVEGGTFRLDAADDALHAGADLTVKGGSWTISSGDDGIHSDENTFVSGGTVTITKSYEGIEGQNISISGGTIDLVSSDDGLNAAGGNDQSGHGGFGGFRDKGGFDAEADSAIRISGGSIHINASGDGVDSNGSLFVSGGETYVSGPTGSGNGSLDYNGEAQITGGIFVAAGSAGMAQNFGDSSTQGAMLVNISGSEKETILLTDSSGKELLRQTVDKVFECVLISCPEIAQGETYTVSVGDASQEVTMDSLIYGSTGIGRFGRKGGGPGGRSGDKKTPPDGMGEPPEDMGDWSGKREKHFQGSEGTSEESDSDSHGL